MEIGHTYRLKIAREVDFGVYMESEKGEILLPQKYLPEGASPGDMLDVFIHRDSEDRLLATTLTPKGQVGDIVVLEVRDTTPHGAFLDWGLEKDLFVPRPEQHVPFQTGDRHAVRIAVDYKTDRLLGTSKLHSFLKKDASGAYERGDEVALIIYDRSPLGMKVIVNRQYFGLIYQSDIFEDLELGDERPGYVREVREDGKLDIVLRKEGLAGMDQHRNILLDKLRSSGGYLNLTDKSHPDEIMDSVQMSKKAFKKAVGNLYRERLITLDADGIRLVE